MPITTKTGGKQHPSQIFAQADKGSLAGSSKDVKLNVPVAASDSGLVDEAKWQLAVRESHAKTPEELAKMLAEKASQLENDFSRQIAEYTAELQRDFFENPSPYHPAGEINFYPPDEKIRLAIKHAERAAEAIGLDPTQWRTLTAQHEAYMRYVRTCSWT